MQVKGRSGRTGDAGYDEKKVLSTNCQRYLLLRLRREKERKVLLSSIEKSSRSALIGVAGRECNFGQEAPFPLATELLAPVQFFPLCNKEKDTHQSSRALSLCSPAHELAEVAHLQQQDGLGTQAGPFHLHATASWLTLRLAQSLLESLQGPSSTIRSTSLGC